MTVPTYELLALIITALSGASALTFFIWHKLIKPARNFLGDQEIIKDDLETIKSEVTTNRGKSLKDSVNALTITCERIEDTQKILDQRSRASLHYQDEALFEVDLEGHLIWVNKKFRQEVNEPLANMEGYNWITTFIDEPERERFIKEFQSCMKTCRKVDIETTSVNGKPIRFVGYPYKVSEKSHRGFLIHLSFKGV